MTGQTATALVAADRSFNRVRCHIPCLHISLIVKYCVSAAASCFPVSRDHVLAMDPGISALVLLCSALLGAGAGSGAGAECGGGDCSTLTRHTLHHWLGRGSRNNNNNVRSLYTVQIPAAANLGTEEVIFILITGLQGQTYQTSDSHWAED